MAINKLWHLKHSSHQTPVGVLELLAMYGE